MCSLGPVRRSARSPVDCRRYLYAPLAFEQYAIHADLGYVFASTGHQAVFRLGGAPSTTATDVPLFGRGVISNWPRIRSARSAMIARPNRPSGRCKPIPAPSSETSIRAYGGSISHVT